MTPLLSSWLDLLRLSASLTVFLDHCAWLWTPGWFGAAWRYGSSDALIVFFVLSGFVIGFVTETKERDAGTYAVNRLARIYSVALPALVATFLLDELGRHIQPGLYAASWGYTTVHRPRQFIRAALFLNEIWWSRSIPGSNAPFWSLAFEMWFYTTFGAARFLSGPARWPAAAACLAIAGPRVAMLFPLWLLGLGAWRLGRRIDLPPVLAWSMAILPIPVLIAIEAGATLLGLRTTPVPMFAHRAMLLLDYPIGLCVAAHLLGMQVACRRARGLPRAISGAIRAAAGMTLTLYLFHFPVAQALSTTNPFRPGSVAGVAYIVGPTIVICALVSRVTEARKEAWRRLILALAEWRTRGHRLHAG